MTDDSNAGSSAPDGRPDMPGKQGSKGTCVCCGAAIDASGATKHLAACPGRKTAIAQAEEKKGASETLFHLRVRDSNLDDFWLDLEMRAGAALKDLDHYLRAIWLECCGHMSEFRHGGWGSPKIGMARKAGDVFEKGVTLHHFYDFGTTSETLIKVVGARAGRPLTKHPIVLLARNALPESKCHECGAPAAWLCIECLIEEDSWNTLCDEHAKTHPHDNYGDPVPLVNSPRLGLCGYEGPADPPY